MNLKTYRLIQTAAQPFIHLYLRYRKFKGKEHKTRFPERLGKNLKPRPDGALIWVHAASIGEGVSVLPLIERIKKNHPQINILMTTGTVTSAKLLEKKLPKNVIHQFIPVDLRNPVKRFLDHFKPNLAIWVESELWPNLVCETHKIGCPLILVNARMSVQSMRKWEKHKEFADEVFSNFSLCLTQSDEETEKFRKLGITNTKTAGNLKYESAALPADPEKHKQMISQIDGRPIFLAASTSSGEEEIIIKAHRLIAEKYPDLLTIIAPRHPARAILIKKLIRDNGLELSQRSADENITPQTEIYLADTIGELGIFYRITSIVFMGGSLVKHGGQNPLEPARLDCALLTGMHIYNFSEIYSEMQQNNAVIMINDEQSLAENVIRLIADSNMRNNYSEKALAVVNSKAGIIDRYMENLSPYMDKL